MSGVDLQSAWARLYDAGARAGPEMRFVACGLLLLLGLLARSIVAHVLFPRLRRLAGKTTPVWDDTLFAALQAPVATLLMLLAIFAAIAVVGLPHWTDAYLAAGARVALAIAIYWIVWRGLAALLDHGDRMARSRGLAVAAFMPWIRKLVLVLLAIWAVLLLLQGFGYNVKALLAGLGIGGLAFALAAQDTLANVFGAVVVATDQPFRIGEAVRIGQNVGSVEDIGIRSTRMRLADKSLMVVPNKTVAAEAITNFSRFTRRRMEQVFAFPYSTPTELVVELVDTIRRIIGAEAEVDRHSIMVYFRDLDKYSLNIWAVYELPDPDFQNAMQCRQRINLAIMAAVKSRGLQFALPTTRVHMSDRRTRLRANDTAAPDESLPN